MINYYFIINIFLFIVIFYYNFLFVLFYYVLLIYNLIIIRLFLSKAKNIVHFLFDFIHLLPINYISESFFALIMWLRITDWFDWLLQLEPDLKWIWTWSSVWTGWILIGFSKKKKKNAGWPTSFFFSPKNWKQTTTKQKPGSDFFFFLSCFLLLVVAAGSWGQKLEMHRGADCVEDLLTSERSSTPPPHYPSLLLHWKATKAADCLDVRQLPLPSWPPAGRQLPQTRNSSHNEGNVS